MKISTKKLYKTRNGYKAKIYFTKAGGRFPVHGAYLRDGYWEIQAWGLDGNVYLGLTSRHDIISEWPPESNLQKSGT